jgi:PDZ domain-containing protein
MLDGSVGPIGGLPMKIRSAEDMGAEVFLYPLDNQADLAGVSTDLELFPVGNLDDALEALSKL